MVKFIILTVLWLLLIATPIIIIRKHIDRKKAREFAKNNLPLLKIKIKKLNEKYKALNNEFKNKHLTELKRQLSEIKRQQNEIIPGTTDFTYFDFIKNIPANAYFLSKDMYPGYQNKNNFSVLLITTPDKERPFGEFTAYITPNGKCYHMAIWCSSRYNSAGFKPVYLFDAIKSGKKPCTKCCDPIIELKSNWFFELQDNIKLIKDLKNNSIKNYKKKSESKFPPDLYIQWQELTPFSLSNMMNATNEQLDYVAIKIHKLIKSENYNNNDIDSEVNKLTKKYITLYSSNCDEKRIIECLKAIFSEFKYNDNFSSNYKSLFGLMRTTAALILDASLYSDMIFYENNISIRREILGKKFYVKQAPELNTEFFAQFSYLSRKRFHLTNNPTASVTGINEVYETLRIRLPEMFSDTSDCSQKIYDIISFLNFSEPRVKKIYNCTNASISKNDAVIILAGELYIDIINFFLDASSPDCYNYLNDYIRLYHNFKCQKTEYFSDSNNDSLSLIANEKKLLAAEINRIKYTYERRKICKKITETAMNINRLVDFKCQQSLPKDFKPAFYEFIQIANNLIFNYNDNVTDELDALEDLQNQLQYLQKAGYFIGKDLIEKIQLLIFILKSQRKKLIETTVDELKIFQNILEQLIKLSCSFKQDGD